MRILFCTTPFENAMTGAGRFAQSVSRISKQFPKLEIHVLSEDISPPEHGPHIHVQISANAQSRYFGYYFKSRDYARAIQKELLQREPDVIFFNDCWLAYHWLSTGNDIPVIAFLHDDNAIKVWQSRATAIPALTVRRWMERSVVCKANAVLTNSAYMQALITRKYQVEARKVRVVPLALTDYSKVTFSVLPLGPSDEIKVLFMKNDYWRGGLGTLIAALSKLTQYRFVLTIAGPEAGIIRNRFSEQLQRLKHVSFNCIGLVSNHSDVFELMRRHHIFCVPSRRESFGVANLEALATGMRMVYAPVGGIPENIQHFAQVIDGYNVSALATGLECIIRNDNKDIVSRARAGREWVIENYQPGKMYQALAEVFKMLIIPPQEIPGRAQPESGPV